MKRIYSLLCAAAVGLSGIAAASPAELTVFAEEETPASGTCGENLTWTFDETNGTLTISGTGEMDDFSEDPCPWKEFQGAIKIINLSDGVTSIGSEAFGGCNGLTEITIPENVKSVGEKAFMLCTNLERIMFMNADCEIFDQDNTISNRLEASPDSDAPRYIYTGSISGYGGSTAEAYARKYKRAFRTLGAVPVEKRDDADLNKDGRVSVADVVMFARSLSETRNAMPIPAGLDLNGDGLITLLDLRELLRTL